LGFFAVIAVSISASNEEQFINGGIACGEEPFCRGMSELVTVAVRAQVFSAHENINVTYKMKSADLNNHFIIRIFLCFIRLSKVSERGLL
jgi:hypothetical protein